MSAPVLFWFRRDLRLDDHLGLRAALDGGGPVVPVFILDDETRNLGAAARLRLKAGLAALAGDLARVGSRLILRRGPALDSLRQLAQETGARRVIWSRYLDPAGIARDKATKMKLAAEDIDVQSFSGMLMFDPWAVETGAGGPYRVFTPFWKAVRGRDVAGPLAAPSQIPAPEHWPDSDCLADWQLDASMQRGASVVGRHIDPGPAAAQARLGAFIAEDIDHYGDNRDRLDRAATSRLSDHLSLGEISPAACWRAGMAARAEGRRGAETFLKQLVWREFAWHLAFHTPHILQRNWRESWDGFDWITDADHPHVRAWQQGRTGVPAVDAAMREMYVTGRMHNRARMLTASYLTKHLGVHWRIGQAWFDDCLIDWDLACNAMGWQWVAGSGPDAAPFFRVFNPDTQAAKFDPRGHYRQRWISEGARDPHPDALSYFEAIPARWNLSPDLPYPEPIVGLAEGRASALAAYAHHRETQNAP